MSVRRMPTSDVLVTAVLVLLVAFTLLIWFDPRTVPALVNQPLDLVLNAGAALVASAVAVLGWIRFRESGDQPALMRAAAFLLLAVQNLVFIGISVAGAGAALGLTLEDPGQLPLWSVIIGRGMAAALLVAAGVAGLRGSDRVPGTPYGLLIIGPVLLFAVITAVTLVANDSLPVLLGPSAIEQLRADPTAPLLAASGGPLILLQTLIGVAFLASAFVAYRLHRRDGNDAELYLAVGFIVAAFSQVHSAIHPGSYASLVTTGDLLRVAFYGVLLLAVAAEVRSDIRALRRANQELIRLGNVEVERATAEERARLAREIHDGMSQELWYAKLKQARLAGMEALPHAARELADEVGGAIEAALSEARQAILALRPAENASFAMVVNRYVEEFADRFAIPSECETDGVADAMPARHQAELLRILQEALTNIHRHADATRVRVRLEATEDGARLAVADNGRGFVVADAPAGRYGLRGMRERAGIIGAELRVESAPSDGTRVIVEFPLERNR